jgi:hypothetical protein
MRAFKSWARGLHWGQLVMVLLGTGLVFGAAGMAGIVLVSQTTDARNTLEARDYCCDERLRRDGIAYRVADTAALRGDTTRTRFAEFLRDTTRKTLPFDRDKAKREGYSDTEIDAYLGLVPDWRATHEELEGNGSLGRLMLGYLLGALSVGACVIFLAVLWLWFGGRKVALR